MVILATNPHVTSIANISKKWSNTWISPATRNSLPSKMLCSTFRQSCLKFFRMLSWILSPCNVNQLFLISNLGIISTDALPSSENTCCMSHAYLFSRPASLVPSMVPRVVGFQEHSAPWKGSLAPYPALKLSCLYLLPFFLSDDSSTTVHKLGYQWHSLSRIWMKSALISKL